MPETVAAVAADVGVVVIVLETNGAPEDGPGKIGLKIEDMSDNKGAPAELTLLVIELAEIADDIVNEAAAVLVEREPEATEADQIKLDDAPAARPEPELAICEMIEEPEELGTMELAIIELDRVVLGESDKFGEDEPIAIDPDPVGEKVGIATLEAITELDDERTIAPLLAIAPRILSLEMIELTIDIGAVRL